MAPRQGIGDQWLWWPWLPTSVCMNPRGSTALMLVPSAMYIVLSAAIAMPLGCDSLACFAGPSSPQLLSSPGMHRSPLPTTWERNALELHRVTYCIGALDFPIFPRKWNYGRGTWRENARAHVTAIRVATFRFSFVFDVHFGFELTPYGPA